MADKEQRNRSESVSLIGMLPGNLWCQEQDVLFTTQTHLTLNVILLRWSHRGPCPSSCQCACTPVTSLLKRGSDHEAMTSMRTGGRPMASEGSPRTEEILCVRVPCRVGREQKWCAIELL